ncbi:hypothetical protein LNKW23_08130 [Paralimibaculum aggregatum]|uniref:Uncharacterized protein n=1 Tax=Paralimibaculum aggregatum TaxID=3036245 RepID=A0ABQ6LE18_9RHOB|nr:type VI secretion protein [Limibaculum sp. NKW23]GMG81600.1 hypothetical protein LNKW23_08130 [Limibaculum sp. NKW23]
MTLPAARFTDVVACPAVAGAVPHAGVTQEPQGPAAAPASFMARSRPGGRAIRVGAPAMIVGGAAAVRAGCRPQAWPCGRAAHGGLIAAPGAPTVPLGG